MSIFTEIRRSDAGQIEGAHFADVSTFDPWSNATAVAGANCDLDAGR